MCEKQPAAAENSLHFQVEDVLVGVDACIKQAALSVYQRVDVNSHQASPLSLFATFGVPTRYLEPFR